MTNLIRFPSERCRKSVRQTRDEAVALLIREGVLIPDEVPNVEISSDLLDQLNHLEWPV